MPVQVIIRHNNDPSYYIEQEFYNPEEINIGSHKSNQIVLEDQNQAVSKYHVQIVRSSGKYFLVDNNSAHGTYINGKKVQTDIPLFIDNSIEFNIGEFDINLTLTGTEAESSKEDIVINNPFDDDVHQLNSILNRLIRKYQVENDHNKQFLLIQAYREILDDSVDSDVLEILFKTKQENAVPEGGLPESPVETLLDKLLQLFQRLFQKQVHFKREFLDETVEPFDDHFPYESLEQLKQYLFDSDIPAEETQARLSQFTRRLETILSHQEALLDGYQFGVEKGGASLVQEIIGQTIGNIFDKKFVILGFLKVPYKWFPNKLRSKIMDQVENEFQVITNQGSHHLEQRHFRSSFVERYQDSIRKAYLSTETAKEKSA